MRSVRVPRQWFRAAENTRRTKSSREKDARRRREGTGGWGEEGETKTKCYYRSESRTGRSGCGRDCARRASESETPRRAIVIETFVSKANVRAEWRTGFFFYSFFIIPLGPLLLNNIAHCSRFRISKRRSNYPSVCTDNTGRSSSQLNRRRTRLPTCAILLTPSRSFTR